MAYAGYNLKINNVIIPNKAIVPGSYSHVPQKRVRSDRTDANGIHHYKYYNTLRHMITFSVRAGTKTEYDTIKTALTNRNNVPVKFWSEDDEDYLSGTFEMEAPTWAHSYENEDTFFYAPTQIKLTEH